MYEASSDTCSILTILRGCAGLSSLLFSDTTKSVVVVVFFTRRGPNYVHSVTLNVPQIMVLH